MSNIKFSSGTKAISAEELQSLASEAKIAIPDDEFDDFRVLIGALDDAAEHMLQFDDYMPTVDYERYPRTDIHIPKDTDMGGWATKVTATCTKPTSDLLKGRTIALKDNIALAGVRCTNGTEAMDWTPVIDATVTTRILDASGVITGKAACENGCFGAISDTSATGPVHNPYAPGYSCGGSSSGSGRLVATGSVDMALGCDQGGSIRLPAAHCGLVGLKPTWGLVPYTGIISLEATIDHVGPMTKDVKDCALLMDVTAGSDGIDDRVPKMLKPGSINFTAGVDEVLALPTESSLKGKKIGILREGFSHEKMDPRVEKMVRSTAQSLTAFGAEVEECSIPLHTESANAWMCALPIAGMRQGLLSDMTGRKQLIMTDRVAKAGRLLSQEAFDAFGTGGQNVYLRGLFLDKKYGPVLHARATNFLRKLNDEYDKMFEKYDVLVMPTLPALAPTLNEGKIGPVARLARTYGCTINTAPFDFSGHPAVSVPIGFSSPQDDLNVKLPVGIQLVGRQYEDLLLLQVAAVWERANNWKDIYVV